MLSTLSISSTTLQFDINSEIEQTSWPMLQNLVAKQINLTAKGFLSMNSRWPLLLSLDLTGNDLSG
jgi:hypothetical protein